MTFGCLNLKKADVPCVSWILNDSTGVVEVINKLNLLRSEVDKASSLLLQSFDFSTLYTKIDLMDLKARMRVLINRVFNQMLKLHRFKFGSKNSFEL
jgi:predicted transcriptional regulator